MPRKRRSRLGRGPVPPFARDAMEPAGLLSRRSLRAPRRPPRRLPSSGVSMNRTIVFATFALGVLAGCMAGAPRPGADTRSGGRSAAEPAGGPLGSPFADPRSGHAALAYPLMLDPTDLRYGTTVQFARIP